MLNFLKKNWSTIVVLVFIMIVEVWLTTAIPQSRKYLYDALASKNIELFWAAFSFFMLVLCGLTFELPVKEYIRSRFSTKIRTSLTESFIDKDLHKADITNPDGRIADDVHIVSTISVRAATEIIIAIMCLVGLVWQIQADPTLLILACVYSAILCVITIFFKTPLMSAKVNLQSSEQSFRRGLINNDEPTLKFQDVVTKSLRLWKVNFCYGFFMQAKNRAVMLILPVVLLPLYMSGHITIGDVFGKIALFDLVVENATIILIYFPEITSFMASHLRIKELLGRK